MTVNKLERKRTIYVTVTYIEDTNGIITLMYNNILIRQLLAVAEFKKELIITQRKQIKYDIRER